MTRIVFMGTPAFAVPALQTLIADFPVVGVVTQPDRPAGRGQKPRPSPVKEVAQAAGIPLFQPVSLRHEAEAQPIHQWAPELIVVVAYGQILRPHLLGLPALGCLNVHASLLPRWRGASPIQHAILAGDSQTGISLMRLDAGLDTGPVYLSQAIPIGPADTAATLHDQLARLGATLLHRHLPQIIEGQLLPLPQDDSRATYAPLIKKEDGLLDWEQPAPALARRVRAMTPWPGAYTFWQGQRLKVLAAQAVDGQHLPPGKTGLVVEQEQRLIVLTADGGLELLRVQLAGRKAASMADFWRGQPHFAGSRLTGDHG